MAVDEEKVIPEINFPILPKNIDDEMREYLTELERVLRDALKGSLLLERTLQDGIFGN